MKKIFLLIAAAVLIMPVMAQTSPIDQMIDKYSEKEGFTNIYISGRMFRMFSTEDSEASDNNENPFRNINSIRVLSVEDSLLNLKLNFYKELSEKVDMSKYEELLLVKEGQQITKFLIKQSGDVISELLVIAGGPGNNSIISITGKLDLKTISEISKNSDIEQLNQLDVIDKRDPKK